MHVHRVELPLSRRLAHTQLQHTHAKIQTVKRTDIRNGQTNRLTDTLMK